MNWLLWVAISLIGCAFLAIAGQHITPEPSIQYATAAPW